MFAFGYPASPDLKKSPGFWRDGGRPGGDLRADRGRRARVDGAHAGGDYSVNSGGMLGGMGSVAGAVAVNAGGMLAPGASIGTFAIGGLTLNNGSFFEFEFNSATLAADLLSVDGDLHLLGAVTLILQDESPTSEEMAIGMKFTMIIYSGGTSPHGGEGWGALMPRVRLAEPEPARGPAMVRGPRARECTEYRVPSTEYATHA